MTLPPARDKCNSPRRGIREEAHFILGWLRRPLRTGAVLPSSRALAQTMAAEVPLATLDEASVVVELGPGTGVVTQALIEAGVPEEKLVLVEYSPEFCKRLRLRFPRARIVEGDAYRPGPAFEKALAGRRTVATVSSLPLMTRPDTEREAALSHHLGRMAPGAPLVQFTYALTLPVAPARIAAKVETTRWVKRNLPPARVLVYRRSTE
ncbi:class I SAM-dependent methyltransferase [Aureimonas populi]|uniref:Class I SAM-dependent methyltransferase n=1 Tax=Aureimonas populi TaxID=1701758 RepID=A0ABW5CRD7_9HYPH|nr:rRNA adenine N-6-methyltransferase family protein [Aureimonas populi]